MSELLFKDGNTWRKIGKLRMVEFPKLKSETTIDRLKSKYPDLGFKAEREGFAWVYKTNDGRIARWVWFGDDGDRGIKRLCLYGKGRCEYLYV